MILHATQQELLAEKSSRVAEGLRENPEEKNLCALLGEDTLPTDPQTFELVARFCHGYAVDLTADNVFPVTWLAYHLGMTDDHRPNNLLMMAYAHFRHNVLPSWNKSLRALLVMERHLDQAAELGLVDEAAESLVAQALLDPRLVADEPMVKKSTDGNAAIVQSRTRANPRRTLFVPDWKTEDLTVLGVKLYEPIMAAMICRRVPLEYSTASMCRYFTKHKAEGDREAVEAVERLLPGGEDDDDEEEEVVIPFLTLVEMLESAEETGSSEECRDGLEGRIGKRLDEATVPDLIFLSRLPGDGPEEKYNAERVKRILKNYCRCYRVPDISGFVKVGDAMDAFVSSVSSDPELKASAFVALGELCNSVRAATNGCSDALYRAADVFLEKHEWLNEREREAVCGVVDCSRMSEEAREHAARNQRMPLRLVVQVLFLSQMKLRDTIVSGEGAAAPPKWEEGGTRRGGDSTNNKSGTKEKGGSSVSVWKKVKRKLGCMTAVHGGSVNCHVKKRNKVTHSNIGK
ncbi:unnamed protein product [Cuscuta campestris]|uniref:NPH3 domain-containing protein n=1 Tax=Cuscuta campestris TaxID=132261 RepID=A0A484LI81_9ASTE|nr:unnamed protein product [Cuscuta campestris]